MSKKKFFFIVFEGAEGTGKSYQINRLYKSLKKKRIRVKKTREPGGSLTAELIRKLIFHKKGEKFNKITDFYLMLAARNEHLKNTILPAKKNKIVLISDRYVDSTYAYQVQANKIDKKINSINNKFIVSNLKPHLTIVLKSKYNAALSRLKKRKNKNKFDRLNKATYTKIQNTFIKLCKSNKNKYALFDSSSNDNNLEKKIFSLVYKKIIK